MLEQGAGADAESVAAMLDKWRQRFAGQTFSPDSVELIREDRNR